jgi:hypothetical protein
MTRRIFDGIILVGLALHLAVGIPRQWARKELAAGGSTTKKVVSTAILKATA